jgi:hypothetical protein
MNKIQQHGSGSLKSQAKNETNMNKERMKNVFFILFAMLVTISTNAQDVILKTDGSEIKAKVLEITDSQIKYKDFDFQDGPTRNISKTQVFRITYENGTSEIFTKPAENKIVTQQEYTKSTQTLQPTTPQKKIFEFSFYLGGTLPLGNFAKSSASEVGNYLGLPTHYFETAFLNESGKYGDAAFGFNVGIKTKWLLYKGLGLFISADLYYNPTSKDLEEKMQEQEKFTSVFTNNMYGTACFDVKITAFQKYVHIPLMVGLNYTHNFNKIIGIWGEGSMGMSINTVSHYTTYNNNYGTFMYYNYNSSTNYYSNKDVSEYYNGSVSFAYSTAVGIMLFKRLSVGIQYFGRMQSQIKGKERSFDFYTKDGSYVLGSTPVKFVRGKLSANMLTFRVGVHF